MEIACQAARVMVTAGGSGIGRVVVETFVAAGARLHVCDVDREALATLQAAHPAIGTTVADVADAAQVDQLFTEAQQQLGGLDILINNAGIAGP
ncbi:MAG: SDR family NAD(P)-dependent oxidoreductase, partial [Caldilineaceae bacterium]|nr:SDR family NAD(P)-dependent oxidoreductase [Caldilineaceae bacterium]